MKFDMPGRTRPVEKIAQAVAKCSTEVTPPVACESMGPSKPERRKLVEVEFRLLFMANALSRIIMPFTKTNVLLSSCGLKTATL